MTVTMLTRLTVPFLLTALAWTVYPPPASGAQEQWSAKIYSRTTGKLSAKATLTVKTNSSVQLQFSLYPWPAKPMAISLRIGSCTDISTPILPTLNISTSTPRKAIIKGARSRTLKAALNSGSVTIAFENDCGTFTEYGAVGTVKSNPYPFGISGRHGEWELTFVSVNFYAAPILKETNQFNPEPNPGWTHVLFRVRAKYLGENSSSLSQLAFDAQAVGASGRTYKLESTANGEWCGVLPEPIKNLEMFPGDPVEGNLFCFPVQEKDVSSLVVFFGQSHELYERTWWAVRP